VRAEALKSGLPAVQAVAAAEDEEDDAAAGAAAAAALAAPAAAAAATAPAAIAGRKRGLLKHDVTGCGRHTLKKVGGRCKRCAGEARDACLVLWKQAKQDGWRPEEAADGLQELDAVKWLERKNVARHHSKWADALSAFETWRLSHPGRRGGDALATTK